MTTCESSNDIYSRNTQMVLFGEPSKGKRRFSIYGKWKIYYIILLYNYLR